MSEELQSLVQIIELYGKGLGGLGRALRFSAKGAAKGVQIAQVKRLQHRMKLHYASEGTHNTMKLCDLEKMTGGRYVILNIPIEGEKELIPFYDRLKKMRVSFAELPDLKLGDGYTQIAYNPDDVENVRLVIDYYKKKGLKTGIYYDPLWMTRTAYDKNLPIKGSDKRTRDIKGNTNFNDFIYWVDTDKEGAEQWVKGYVRYFIELGFSFLRIDFLNWFEDSYGTDRYVKALRWIKEEAGDEIFVSLVMPNCFDHAANEIPYGDLFRISEDVFGGGWDFISNRRRGVQQDRWAQWGNVFDGFVGFSDVAARGQIIMDGDFIRLNTCADDNERQFWVSLMAITGSPIAIADQYDTANGCERFYRTKRFLPSIRRDSAHDRHRPIRPTWQVRAGSDSCPTAIGS